MTTIEITNPVIEKCLQSLADVHHMSTSDLVAGALASQFGCAELAYALTGPSGMSEVEEEQLNGAQA